MFCENCGKEVNENDVFCSNCGYSLGYKNNIEQTIQKSERIEQSHTKNKWVTLLLYFLPALGWFGIYNIYAGRKKGLIQIGLWAFSFLISFFNRGEYGILNKIFSVMSILIFILWIIDIVWVLKLPKKY